jgi:hypothetical protein
MMDNNKCTLQNTWTYKLQKETQKGLAIEAITFYLSRSSTDSTS